MVSHSLREEKEEDMKKSVIKKAFKPCAGCKSKAACTKMGKCLAKSKKY